MERENTNQTVITEFILNGLTQHRLTKILLFVLFLCMYFVTICGNLILICTFIASSHMHTPMYYFLCHLSVNDLFYSSSTIPKMLLDMTYEGRGRISFVGCMIQMTISLFLAETECILLAVMAYDRYVAICFPLHYMVIMSWRRCKNITVIVWLGCFICSVFPSVCKPHEFCKGNLINHFICETLALLELFCGNTSSDKIIIILGSIAALLIPFAFIVISYICIIRSLFQIMSVDGRKKAFSTCASHLTVVIMFYGTCMTMYIGQERHFAKNLKFISVFYVIVTPMLNPLIYSLRNNDVKGALKKMLNRNSL